MIELPLTGSPSSLADAAREPDFQTDPARLADSGPTLPHVVAWNLTRRCNLACAHCYISAGSWESAEGELDTADCLRIVDEILEVNPAPMLILSGGEPLVRDDLERIAARAARGGATVVVGTNGTGLTDERIASLMEAGVKGVAVSVDSLDPEYHDRFRMASARRGGRGADDAEDPGADEGSGVGGSAGGAHDPSGAGTAGTSLPTVGAGAGPESSPAKPHSPPLEATLAAVERLRRHRLDFVVQTTVTRGNRDELSDLAAWAAGRGAVSFNVYFLVPTGRGGGMKELGPAANREVLDELLDLEDRYRGRMLVRPKCQPQVMRLAVERGSDSSLLNYRTRCPCGVQYCRITPEGKVTPCPYTPLEAGDLTLQPFRQVWESSPVFGAIRSGSLEGRCGRCEYREVCGGCRARAHALTGSILGTDDACDYDPPEGRPLVRAPRDVTYGAAPDAPPDPPPLAWSDEARERVERIPSFVRGVVTSRVEAFARERGFDEVTPEVMREVRRSMPVDFSERLPFFLRDGGEE